MIRHEPDQSPARAVAPDGTVVGIDLSAAVLAFAERAAKGRERVRFVQVDAQTFSFEPASFDAAFSRFGVMFFADPDRVRGILEGAGFAEIEITARDEQVGSGDLETMLAVCSRVGALGKILRENPGLRAATLPSVRAALAAHDGPEGVRLNAATWIVTARAQAMC